MLLELSINQFILIESLKLQFSPRLNMLSGETGAGKSIIIDALGFVLGQKPDKSLIRTGSDSASVRAVFKVTQEQKKNIQDNFGVSADEELIVIARELFSSARSTVRINGEIVTNSILEGIGEVLVDFHGQHQHQSLLHSKHHLRLLDVYIGGELKEFKEKLYEIVRELYELEKTIKAYGSDSEELDRKIESMHYEIDEIEKVALQPEEDVVLEETFQTLNNTEQILKNLYVSNEILNGENEEGMTVIKGISESLKLLGQISEFNKDVKLHENRLNEHYHGLMDTVRELSRLAETIYFDEEVYHKTSERLDQINQLKRKYGTSIEGILSDCDSLKDEVLQLEEKSKFLLRSQDKRIGLIDEYKKISRKISAIRTENAKILEDKICFHLKQLNLPNAQIKINIIERADPYGKGIHQEGIDLVEILISTNLGEGLKPLKQVASGGELSRVMLAIKIVLAQDDLVGTLVFDEIDSGISGKAAAKVGEKLVEVSKYHQVLCISHLAQICALGDSHYLIEKNIKEESTITEVFSLNGDQRIHEISRILGGVDVSEASYNASLELIQHGNQLRMIRDNIR